MQLESTALHVLLAYDSADMLRRCLQMHHLLSAVTVQLAAPHLHATLALPTKLTRHSSIQHYRTQPPV